MALCSAAPPVGPPRVHPGLNHRARLISSASQASTIRSALRRDMPFSISSSCCQANLRDSGGSNELSVTGSYAFACSPAGLAQLALI